MLCTECSRPVLPVVSVDIDGTLAHYHGPLEKFACNYWDVPIPRYAWDGRGNFEDHMNLTQAEYREAKLAYRQGGYKRVAPLYEGALEFMARLAGLPCELWISTTRPWSRLDNVDPDTKFWLERHHIQYDHLLFDDMKYRQLAEIVDPQRVVAVVDDLPEQLDSAAEWLPKASRLLVGRPHNFAFREDYQWEISLMGCLGTIIKRVNAWQHGA